MDSGKKFIDQRISALNAMREHMAAVDRIGHLLIEVLQKKKTIFACGNGGSMDDAMHFATELSVRFRPHTRVERPALPARALGTDLVFMTACSNDFGAEEVFARDLEAHIEYAGALIAISTSGESKNVICATQMANLHDIPVIGLTGSRGGLLSTIVSYPIQAPSNETAIIQELHRLVIHRLAGMVDEWVMARQVPPASI